VFRIAHRPEDQNRDDTQQQRSKPGPGRSGDEGLTLAPLSQVIHPGVGEVKSFDSPSSDVHNIACIELRVLGSVQQLSDVDFMLLALTRDVDFARVP